MSQGTTEIVKTESAIPVLMPSVSLFSTDASQLGAMQEKMGVWVRMRIAELENDMIGLQAELDIALQNNWRPDSWRRQINQLDKRVKYYQKIEAVIKEGYVLVPSMPMDVFAVRTTKNYPPRKIHGWGTHRQAEQVAAETAPGGTGKYVSSDTDFNHWRETRRDSAGKETTVDLYQANAFNEIEYPLDVAKPVVMERTAAAMALKVFDEIGVVRDGRPNNRRGDPFVLGRICDPRQNRNGVCFFIGWCFDLRSL